MSKLVSVGILSAFFASVAMAVPTLFQQQQTPSLPFAVADHHMHVQGSQLTKLLNNVAKKHPEEFEGMSQELLKKRTTNTALIDLDSVHVKYGVLLSEAYMFASPIMHFNLNDEQILKYTRQENLYNVDTARASGGRLIAFVGIDPLASNAISELRYWAHVGGADGVKLHLANSAFNPKLDADVEKLKYFFDEARLLKMPLIVHVRHTKNYTAEDIQIFLDEVLPHAGDLPVQIAHAGGWGGLDNDTLTALSEYAGAIRHHKVGTRNIFFDLALVVMHDGTDSKLLERLVLLMREIGLNRFVLGSDWPAMYTTEKYYSLLEGELPLTRDEWLVILCNRAPWLRPGHDRSKEMPDLR